MSMEVSSNLEQVIQRLHERASRMSSEYTAVLFNNVSYASAVENGYTRTLRWADMSKEQRGAIFASMKKREKQGARQILADPKQACKALMVALLSLCPRQEWWPIILQPYANTESSSWRKLLHFIRFTLKRF